MERQGEDVQQIHLAFASLWQLILIYEWWLAIAVISYSFDVNGSLENKQCEHCCSCSERHERVSFHKLIWHCSWFCAHHSDEFSWDWTFNVLFTPPNCSLVTYLERLASVQSDIRQCKELIVSNWRPTTSEEEKCTVWTCSRFRYWPFSDVFRILILNVSWAHRLASRCSWTFSHCMLENITRNAEK